MLQKSIMTCTYHVLPRTKLALWCIYFTLSHLLCEIRMATKNSKLPVGHMRTKLFSRSSHCESLEVWVGIMEDRLVLKCGKKVWWFCYSRISNYYTVFCSSQVTSKPLRKMVSAPCLLQAFPNIQQLHEIVEFSLYILDIHQILYLHIKQRYLKQTIIT